MRRSLHKRTRQGLFPIVVKIGGKLTENLIISGWTFSGIGSNWNDRFLTTCYFWAEKQISFKQTEMFHEGGFLSQKESACQAFSKILAKRAPRVLLKQANTLLWKYFTSKTLAHRKWIHTFSLNTNSYQLPDFGRKNSPPEPISDKLTTCYGPEIFVPQRKVWIYDWYL